MGNLAHSASLDVTDYVAGINKMKQETSSLTSSVVQESEKMDESLRKFGLGLAAYFTFDAAKGFISKLTQVRGEFQQLEIGLETMLGSRAKADALMADITDFATKTPFEVGGIASATKQLVAYGVASEEVIDVIRRLGDISSGLNIPLQDLSYLYGTTLVQGRMYAQDLMQFSNRGIPLIQELAKQFNVSTSEVKELVSQGKVGFPEVEKAIKAMTDQGGRFAGLTEKNSQALTGLISNLEDAIQNALNDIGKEQEGVLVAGVKGAISAVEHYEQIAKAIGVIIAAVGTYKAALIAVNVFQKAVIAAGNIQAWFSMAKGIKTSKDAMLLFNMACKANPLILVISALTAATAALFLFRDSSEKAKKELSSLEKIQEKTFEQFEEQRGSVDTLTATLNSHTASLASKKEALEELNKLIPNYCGELNEEGVIINSNTEAIKNYLTQLEKQIKLKAAQEELEALYRKKRSLEKDKQLKQEQLDAAKAAIPYDNIYGDAGVQYQRYMIKEAEKAEKAFSKSSAELAKTEADILLITNEIENVTLDIEQAKGEAAKMGKTYAQQLEDAKSDVIRIKKEIDDLRSGKILSSDYAKDIEELLKSLKAAESKVQTLTGSKEDPAEEQRKQLKIARDKILLQRELAEKEIAQNRETENAISQAYILSSKEGFEKQQAIQLLEHKKNLQNIQLRADEMKKATYAYNKRVWESLNEGFYETSEEGKKGWQSIKLTPEQQAQIDALILTESHKWSETQQSLIESELSSLYDYLKQYGSIQEQKYAIAASYDRKILQESNYWRKQSLQAEKEQLLDSINSNELVKQLNLELLFSEYGNVLAAPLEETLEALENYTKTDSFKSRSLEDQKSIFQSMDQARAQLGSLGQVSMESVGKSLYDYNNALIEYNNASKAMTELSRLAAEAQEKELIATQKLTEAKDEEAKAQAEVNLQKAKDENTQAQQNFLAGQNNFKNAQTSLVEAQNQATRSLQEFQFSINKVGDIASAVASGSMSQLWKALGTKTQNRIGQFISGTQQYGDAIAKMTAILTESGSSLDSFINKISNLAEELYKTGKSIDALDISARVQEIFSEAFGDENLDISKFGEKVSGILSEALSSTEKIGDSLEETSKEVAKKVSTEVVKEVTSSSGSLWGLVIGLVFDLLEILKNGIGTLVQTILEMVGDAVEGLLSEIGSGRIINRIVMGIGNLIASVFRGVANLLTFGLAFRESDSKELQEKLDDLTSSNQELVDRIESLTEVIKDSDTSNKEAIEAYQKALQAEKEWIANQQQMINESASQWSSTGYGFLGLSGMHSFNAGMYDLPDWIWEEFTNTLNSHGYDTNVSPDSIWSLSPEEMKILRDFAPSAWAELFSMESHSNPVDLVNEYIDRAGSIDALTEALNEKLTGYSWDSFKNSYADLLKDLTSSTADFASNIQELITNALINSFVNSEEIKNRIQELYKKIAEYASPESEGGELLTEEEINYIRQYNEDLANDMLAWRQSLLDAGILKPDSEIYKQYASQGGFSTMTQTQAESLEGRFTALQVTSENILASIVELQTLISLQLSHLEVIATNSKMLLEINSSLLSIKEKLKNL